MLDVSERALALLRLGTKSNNAVFRNGQKEAILHIVEGGKRLLVVQKTGWGKSFVYFIATKILREMGMGTVILISPLLALMRNQIAAASRMGVRAQTINSTNTSEWKNIEQEILNDEIDILLISPERLANEDFNNQILAKIAPRISLLVVDEAHCISDWGHDFRPDYRRLERIIRLLPPNVRVLATTATANNRVMDDLQNVLGKNLLVFRGDLNRPSLTLQTISLPSQVERLAWIAEQLNVLQGSGIIYVLTVRDANLVANWLKTRGVYAEAYTGEMDNDTRERLEDELLNNKIKVLVATTALGMGYDKPDLSFVIHYQMPGSVVAYYQQVGRAGRALESAYGILLSGEEEVSINDYFIDSAFPNRKEVDLILKALKNNADGLSIVEIEKNVNLSRKRIDNALKMLSLETPAPIVKQGSKWQLTTAPLQEAFWQRAERLTNLRHQEQRQMCDYLHLPFGEHMKFLIQALDGDLANLTPPKLPPLPETISPSTIQDALDFLRRSNLSIEPRKQWPVGGLPKYGITTRTIAPNHCFNEGRALCHWGDAGWGMLVKNGKYQYNQFSDELVVACEQMFREWNLQPVPTWVTCIPSLRHPDLVPNFAKRLAAMLNLPFYQVLQQTNQRPQQKHMANSTYQALNVDGALKVIQPVPQGAVLLVDDMVDSRWTLTVATWLLRTHGSGEVFPLVLAQTGK